MTTTTTSLNDSEFAAEVHRVRRQNMKHGTMNRGVRGRPDFPSRDDELEIAVNQMCMERDNAEGRRLFLSWAERVVLSEHGATNTLRVGLERLHRYINNKRAGHPDIRDNVYGLPDGMMARFVAHALINIDAEVGEDSYNHIVTEQVISMFGPDYQRLDNEVIFGFLQGVEELFRYLGYNPSLVPR